jgi:hypothetical protein
MIIAKIISPVIGEKKLTTADRKHISKKKEAVPSKHGEVGSYPMPDQAHANSAKGFASMHHGKGSTIYKKVAAKAKSLGYYRTKSI